MAYLARIEDTEFAEIEWKFDFSDRKLKINDISLQFGIQTYESGQIDISFLHKGKLIFQIFPTKTLLISMLFFLIPGKVLPNFQSIKNLDSFSIRVKLLGGNGDCAWQHTQLFRQSLSDIEKFPFELKITFF